MALGSRLKKIVICAICALAVVALGFVGYRLFLTYRTVAAVPNPETFFGVSADIDRFSSGSSKRITYLFEFDEDPSDAVQAYSDLLESSVYPFYLGRQKGSDNIEYYFYYNGSKDYIDNWQCDILIENCGANYYTNSDAWVVKIYVYNSSNFKLVSAETYDWDRASVLAVDTGAEDDIDAEIEQDADIEMIYALDPDAFFGTEGELIDGGLKYYVDESHEFLDVYGFEVLCDEYGFIFASINEYDEYLELELVYGDDSSETVIWLEAYDDSIVVYWNEEIIQWITPDGYETDVNVSTDSDIDDDSTNEETTTTEKTLVAEEISAGSVSKPSSDVMDLLYYAQAEITFGEESTSGKSTVRSFKGTASDYDVLYDYVELLCDEYDFELVVDPYYNDSSSTYTFVEFVLNYTGSKTMIAGGITGTYTQNAGDIMIYAEIERDRLEGAIWIDSALEISDDGYVYGSDSGGASYIGDSFGAGLYRLADGSYQTTDGRLTASVGEAMVISDGTSSLYNSVYYYDNDENRQEIYIENDYGTEQQVIYIPTTVTLTTGQIFDSSYFIIDRDSQTNNRGVSTNVPAFTWTSMYACLHDGNYVIPVRGLSGVMTDVNVRVMYVDDTTAVFYTCLQFESEPYEVESLIAVTIGADTVLENQPDGEYTIYVGESIEIIGPWESSAGHNLWTWEYLEGSQLSELTGTTSQTCTLTGNKVGDVRVKVTYDYSVQEPDVLTGISRTVQKIQEQEFVVHIVNK